MNDLDRNLADQVLALSEARFDQAVADWMAWLRIPSVSAQPQHRDDCRKAADWAGEMLRGLDFQVEIIDTPGHPVVLARYDGPADAPHLLYYGHYDVQPPEPLDLWTAPPFDPQLVDGPHGKRVVARGAVDDKGQVAMWLAAFTAWHAQTGSLPARITVLLEGEEEIGSPNLEPFVMQHQGQLAADVVVISDTGMWDIDTPALTTSLRGMCYMEVSLTAADRDLHSGMFGGSALNPINALTKALGQLHDSEGRVALPGFYDDVIEVSEAQKAAWQKLGFSEHDFLAEIGLSVPVGEQDRSALERLWSRPTADINGIWGGYTGAGSKTVIASKASAKVSFRLVPGQDPQKVAQGFAEFMQARVPADARLQFEIFSGSPGLLIDTDNSFVRCAVAAMEREFGREVALIGCGGSIPIVESFRRVLGLDSILMGFSLQDDKAHSPNEKFEISCFRHGMRSHIRLLAGLAPVR